MPNDNEWQRVTSSGTINGNEWFNEWQRVIQQETTNDNEWQRVTKNDNKCNGWLNEWIRMRVSKIEWSYVSIETKGQSGRPICFLNNFFQFCLQYVTTVRISRLQMFFEICVLKVCNIHREKRLCWNLLLVKLETWSPINLLERDSNTDVFLWILRTI